MTNREKLDEALRLLGDAQKDLNVEAAPCHACGLHVKANWSEAQAAESLRSARTKLGRLLEHEDLQAWLDRL